MFGALRFYLAIVVIFVHFSAFSGVGWDGIFAFFVMSGYLMTLILHKNYGYTLRGLSTYSINRILRIYPMYWLACLLAIAVLLFLGDDFRRLNGSAFGMPETGGQWLRNLLLIVKEGHRPVLIQPAWTLTVEVFFYGCIGLGLSRTKTVTAVWLVCSLLYTGYLVATGADFYSRYFTIAAASLPFSVGAAIYHWGDILDKEIPWLGKSNTAPWVFFGLYLLNQPLALVLGTTQWSGFYLGFLFLSILIFTLRKRRQVGNITRSTDAFLGDMSYPMYLVHAPLAWLLLYLCKLAGLPITRPSPSAFFAFILPTLLVAWVIYILVEKRLDRQRQRIKQLL